MATSVKVSLCHMPGTADPLESLSKVEKVFSQTERSCSRFDPSSDLSKLNRSPQLWHSISPWCFRAVLEAYQAYTSTDGLFDPRVLTDLVSLGYRESWTKGGPDPKAEYGGNHKARPSAWSPEFKGEDQVLVGEYPIDLGGIGKGLALRWAAEEISPEQGNFLIEAGGDCICAGAGPTESGWNIGVENPFDQDNDPVMVLNLQNQAVCTSSTAVRSWWQNGKLRHHLIDPRTGQPGSEGLAAVTVISEDPAVAETWSKSLFLMGEKVIGKFSEGKGIPALWITDRGDVIENSLFNPYIIWRRPLK